MTWSFVGSAAVTMTDTPSGPYAGKYVASFTCPPVMTGDLLIYVNGSPRTYDGGATGHPLLEPVGVPQPGFTNQFESSNTHEAFGMQLYTKVAAAADSLASMQFVYGDDYNLPHGEFVVYRNIVGIDTHSGGLFPLSDVSFNKCDDVDGSHAQAHFDSLAGLGAQSDDLYLAIAYCHGYTGAETTPAGLTKRLAHSDGFTGILIYDRTGVGSGSIASYGSTDASSSSGATAVFAFTTTASTGVSPPLFQGASQPWRKPGQFAPIRGNTSRIVDNNPPLSAPASPPNQRASWPPWFKPGQFAPARGSTSSAGGGLLLVNDVGGSALFRRLQ